MILNAIKISTIVVSIEFNIKSINGELLINRSKCVFIVNTGYCSNTKWCKKCSCCVITKCKQKLWTLRFSCFRSLCNANRHIKTFWIRQIDGNLAQYIQHQCDKHFVALNIQFREKTLDIGDLVCIIDYLLKAIVYLTILKYRLRSFVSDGVSISSFPLLFSLPLLLLLLFFGNEQFLLNLIQYMN